MTGVKLDNSDWPKPSAGINKGYMPWHGNSLAKITGSTVFILKLYLLTMHQKD